MFNSAPKLSRALQVAIDTTDIFEALALAEKVRRYADWIELGTPLLLARGLRIVPMFREQTGGKPVLADTKIVDAGFDEAYCAMGFEANACTVLGLADDLTVRGCVAATFAGTLVVADMMHVPNVAARAVELEALGVDVICLHTAWDRRQHGIEVLKDLREVRRRVKLPIAVAGGITLANCRKVLDAGADILVVGGGITKQPDPEAAAREFRMILDEPLLEAEIARAVAEDAEWQ